MEEKLTCYLDAKTDEESVPMIATMVECEARTRKLGNALGITFPKKIIKRVHMKQHEKITILILKHNEVTIPITKGNDDYLEWLNQNWE